MTSTTTDPNSSSTSGRAEATFAQATARGRAMGATPEFRVVVGLVLMLILWGSAIATFGYPALILPVLALVPVMFVVLLLITVGK